MAFLGLKDEAVRRRWIDLVKATDGTENCYDVRLMSRKARKNPIDSHTDAFVESWSGSLEVDSKTAQEMCAGCHLLQQCGDYARFAGEKEGVWGGTTPADRGYKKRYKAER